MQDSEQIPYSKRVVPLEMVQYVRVQTSGTNGHLEERKPGDFQFTGSDMYHTHQQRRSQSIPNPHDGGVDGQGAKSIT